MMNSKLSIVTLITTITVVVSYSISAQDTDSKVAGTVELPSGVIVMWSGSLAEIPGGWTLCDGTKGTPDLRDRFVMGVGASKYSGTTGGSYTHSHRMDGHSHRIAPPSSNVGMMTIPYESRWRHSPYGYTLRSHRYYTGKSPFTSGVASSRMDNVQHLPPYFKIAFIMKE